MSDRSQVKHFLAFLAWLAFSGHALAQPAPATASAYAHVPVVAETHALMASLSESMEREQAELQIGMREATARAKWSEQDRARFLQKILRSMPNAGFDKRIATLTAELRAMLQASQRGEIKGSEANHRYVLRLRELLTQLKSVYALQTAYILQQLRDVKP